MGCVIWLDLLEIPGRASVYPVLEPHTEILWIDIVPFDLKELTSHELNRKDIDVVEIPRFVSALCIAAQDDRATGRDPVEQ